MQKHCLRIERRLLYYRYRSMVRFRPCKTWCDLIAAGASFRCKCVAMGAFIEGRHLVLSNKDELHIAIDPPWNEDPISHLANIGRKFGKLRTAPHLACWHCVQASSQQIDLLSS